MYTDYTDANKNNEAVPFATANSNINVGARVTIRSCTAILGFAMGCGLEKSPNSLWTRGKKQRAAYMSKKIRIITIKCERRLIHICVDFS